MPRRYTSTQRNAFVSGMEAAESKGFAAGQDRQFTEADCPYKRFEHRKCWLDGFRRARHLIAANEAAFLAEDAKRY